MRKDLVAALLATTNAPGTALAPAALALARIEHPRLDAERYLARLDAMGDAARRAVQRQIDLSGDNSTRSCIRAINEYLYEEMRFVGNRDQFEDPRNSCLNEVLDRRTGKPLFPVENRPVPSTRIDGEQLSTTQPVPMMPLMAPAVSPTARTKMNSKATPARRCRVPHAMQRAAVHRRCGTPVTSLSVPGNRDPGSAAHHFMLRCARDTRAAPMPSRTPARWRRG